VAEIVINEELVVLATPADATGYLLVDVLGVGYYTTVKNGEGIFYLPKLAPGNYTIGAIYTGDKKYSAFGLTDNITIEETIISKDLIKIEKSPDRFEATFTDINGTPLADTNVTVEINKVTSTRTTDANGTLSMAINLGEGIYPVTLVNPVTGEEKMNLITVLPRIISNDLVKYYRNDSQFIVEVLGDDGLPAKAGENVSFNINGVFYTKQTDELGVAQMNINLPAGNYTVTTEYKGCKAANNIEVLPIITAEDLTKKYGEATPFEATLVDGQGKPLAGVTMDFNINGVMYHKQTDENGVAKLNINLIAGEYIITSSYNGFNTANKVTITA
ncbi:MAG: carboxypeptidase regulatory-like domain-containing protein, partial [Methanobrevibacter sp.]|nr:carboxypeptidase regulatory-like domain-containing protein [Methanobrevibacter sp.]